MTAMSVWDECWCGKLLMSKLNQEGELMREGRQGRQSCGLEEEEGLSGIEDRYL